jgi:hypothetical protein
MRCAFRPFLCRPVTAQRSQQLRRERNPESRRGPRAASLVVITHGRALKAAARFIARAMIAHTWQGQGFLPCS